MAIQSESPPAHVLVPQMPTQPFHSSAAAEATRENTLEDADMPTQEVSAIFIAGTSILGSMQHLLGLL